MSIDFLEIAKSAKNASLKALKLSDEIKNQALLNIAENLKKRENEIFDANKNDLDIALKLLETGEITQSVYNRLKLDENKLRDMIQGIIDVSKLPDPVNKIIFRRELDKGLILSKISCPIGVLGIIFEARPDVIAQISALAVKSSNAVILKGGKEAANTNKIIHSIINSSLKNISEFPDNFINQVYSRDDVAEMLKADKYINLIIPRGGNKLVQYIKSNTNIPVLGHADGICHIFADDSADLDTAIKIIIDSKTQYPSACNSVETLLIHKNFKHTKELLNSLKNAGIKIIEDPDSWHKEYSDKILAVKIVNNVSDAILHINEYGSGHTESIITNNNDNAELFMDLVDSAGVYHNTSTRFADGFRYGFGAEVGISTNKTHARGPVGIDGLVIYKYKLQGCGNIVADYVSGEKHFTHKEL